MKGRVKKVKRIFKILADGNFAWVTHRFLRCFSSMKEHPCMLAYVQAQKIKPVLSKHSDAQRNSLQSLKVLLVSHDLKREGAALSLFELAGFFLKKLSMGVVVLSLGEGPLEQAYIDLGIKVHKIPCVFDELTTLKRLSDLTQDLGALIATVSPDIIFANTLASFPAVLEGHNRNIPSIWNIREGQSVEAGFFALPCAVVRVAASCVARANRIVFVSKSTRQKWRPYEPLGHFEVIPNSLSPDRISSDLSNDEKVAMRVEFGLQRHSFVFLSVGTLEPRKGQLDLIQAFENLPANLQKQCEIVFLGGQEHAYAQKLIRRGQNGASRSRIHFIKSSARVMPLYGLADAFVLCSRSESYPRVILEAMSVGLPILSTNVDGIPEQVVENENVTYYQVSDFLGLSNAMSELLLDENKVRMMGKRSREIFKTLPDFEEMGARYRSVLQGVLN